MRRLSDPLRLAALVTLRADAAMADCVKRLHRAGTPVVDLTINRPDIRLPRVTSDHAALGRLAAEHFSERDFRHVAWFSLGWTHVHKLRFEALAATGLSPKAWLKSP